MPLCAMKKVLLGSKPKRSKDKQLLPVRPKTQTRRKKGP